MTELLNLTPTQVLEQLGKRGRYHLIERLFLAYADEVKEHPALMALVPANRSDIWCDECDGFGVFACLCGDTPCSCGDRNCYSCQGSGNAPENRQ